MDVVKNKGKRPPTGWAEFGERLKQIRTQRGLSRDEVAQSTSVDATSLFRIEKGEQWVSPKALQELGAFLDAPIADFFSPVPRASPATMAAPEENDSALGLLRSIIASLAALNEHQLALVLRTIRGLTARGAGNAQDSDDRIKRG